MSIYRTYILLFSFLILLLFSLLLTLIMMERLQVSIETTANLRHDSYKLAEELRQSSDDLTKLARLYVMTDDQKYANYFQEVLDIRNGVIPRPENYHLIYWDLVFPENIRPTAPGTIESLEDRMIEHGFTSRELLKLSEAQNKSDKLVHMETTAFNAMNGLFRNPVTENFSEKGEPNPELARQIMFSQDYINEKALIMKPINEFFSLLENRTQQELDIEHEHGHIVILAAIIISFSAFCLSIVSIIILRRKVLKPIRVISESTRMVAKGDYSHEIIFNSHDELGNLVEIFNRMLVNTRKTMNELQEVNNELKQQRELLAQEKAKSESLLQNILPTTIADRLKQGESTIADEFPEVSVMFADIVGFTALSEKIGPHELVKLLNEIFGRFDMFLDKFGLEKIKTIGDCYMVVSGLPESHADHANRIAEFALAVKSGFPLYNVTGLADDSDRLNIRIGIHSGPAVAGVIGTKKLAYDLWGDVVNVASRMQTYGEVGEIHVSEPFMIRLKDSYIFEERGVTEIKGKGKMKTYSLINRRYERA